MSDRAASSMLFWCRRISICAFFTDSREPEIVRERSPVSEAGTASAANVM